MTNIVKGFITHYTNGVNFSFMDSLVKPENDIFGVIFHDGASPSNNENSPSPQSSPPRGEGRVRGNLIS